MIMHAGDEGVAAGDAVHQAVLTQELQRAVGRDRRRAHTSRRQFFDNVIGAKRLVAGEQRGEHFAPDGREALAAFETAPLRNRHRVVEAAVVVVIRRGEHGRGGRVAGCHRPYLRDQSDPRHCCIAIFLYCIAA